VANLDPGSRALLDLSIRRGLPDEELADLLRSDPGEVARRREGVLDRLAAEVGLDGEKGRDAVRASLAGAPAEALAAPVSAEQPSEPDGHPHRRDHFDTGEIGGPPATAAPLPHPAGPSRRVVLAVAAVLAAGALVGAVIALSSRGEGEGADANRDAPTTGRDAPTTARERPTPERPVKRDVGRAVRLRAVGARTEAGSATARLVGRDRVRIAVNGLPDPDPDSYEVWLYDSVADAVSLGRLGPGASGLEARLPTNPGDYRYLDISREPKAGTRAHSGASVLRVPVSRLAR